jgi:hypothetical protein
METEASDHITYNAQSGGSMSKHQGLIELSLTPEQQERMRKQAGRTGHVAELSIMELEERIAPGFHNP